MNIVIGFYSNYPSLDTDKGGLRIFVNSFRKYNQKDLIVVCYVPPIKCEDLIEFCDKNNCLLESVELEDVKTGNRWSQYYHVINKLSNIFTIENLLIIDMNDAIFQSDPFQINVENKLHCACEKTTFATDVENNYNSVNINTTWMNQTQLVHINNDNLKKDKATNLIEKSIYNNPILCSGTILGNYDSICKLLSWGKNKTGADQGLLNVYVYSVLDPTEYKAPLVDVSDILTMDSIQFNSLRKNKDGFILNKNNKIYSICHQIDRGCGLHHFLNIGKQ